MDSYSVQAILTVKDNMSAALKNAAGATGTLGGKFKSVIGTGALLQVGMGAVSKAVSTMTAHIDSAVSRYDQLNNFPRVMNNLGISSKAASSALKQLDKGITGLPTTLDSATQGVTRFVSKNGDIKKSTDYFLAMNNAVLAGGASVESQGYAVEQLSQAYAKGKMDMEEWRSIQTAMPAQLNQVAKAMGMTADELGEGLRNGTISMDEFMDTMVKLNKEGVDGFASFEKQAKSATGGIKTALTNMSTAITRGIANSIGAIDELLVKNNLPTIAEMINKAGTSIENTFKKISGAIKNANINGIIAGITPAFTVLKTAAKGAMAVMSAFISFCNKHAEALLKIASAIAGAAIAFKAYKSVTNTAKKIKDFTDTVKGSMTAVSKLTTALDKNVLEFAVSHDYITKQEAAYGYLGNRIKNTITSIASFIKSNAMSAASAISNAAVQTVSAIANSRVGSAAKTAAVGVLKFAAAHRVAMIAALGFLAPIIALVAYMSKTGASADEVANKITSFANKSASAITAFADKMPQIMDAIVQALTDNIDSIVAALTEVINSVVKVLPTLLPIMIEAGIQLFMGLVEAVTQIIEPLTAALPQIIEAIVSAIPILIPAIIEAGIMLFSALVDAIPQVIPVIIEALPQIVDAIVSAIPVLIPAIIEGGVTLFSALIDAIPKVLPVIVAAVPKIVKAIVKGLLQLAGEMLQAGVQLMKSFLNGLKSLFGKIVSSVVNFAKSLPGKIKSGLGSLVSVGKNFIAGLWNGIKAKFDAVIDKVKSLASKLPKVVKKVLGIASPSKIMAEIGVFFDQGLESGISKGIRAVQNTAKKLGTATVDAVDVSGLKSKFSEARKWAEQLMYIPNIASLDFAFAGEVNSDYRYGSGRSFVIEVPVNMDGKEVARITAPFTEEELNKRQTRENRKKGRR